jgi:hypothetical protein
MDASVGMTGKDDKALFSHFLFLDRIWGKEQFFHLLFIQVLLGDLNYPKGIWQVGHIPFVFARIIEKLHPMNTIHLQ